MRRTAHPNDALDHFGEGLTANPAAGWGITSPAFLLSALGGLAVLMFVGMKSEYAIIPWFLCAVCTFVGCRILGYIVPVSRDFQYYALFSYVILSLIGLVLIIQYRSLTGVDFAPYADDSRYYHNIMGLANGNLDLSELGLNTTVYEHILAEWYRLISLFRSDVYLLDVLPMNWMLGAWAVALASQLAANIVGGRSPLWVCLGCLLTNCVFTDSLANLYRDGLMLVLLLLSIMTALQSRYGYALLFALLCGAVRGANGMIALLFIVIVAAFRSKNNSTVLVLKMMMCAAFLAFALSVDHALSLSQYLRSFSGADAESQQRSLIEDAAERPKAMMEGFNPNIDSSSTTSALYSGGLAGKVFMPVASIFAPLRIGPIYAKQTVKYYVKGKEISFAKYGVRPGWIFEWITVIAWLVFGPYLVTGAYLAISDKTFSRPLLMIFVVTVLAVTFVSFQPRHRSAFLVLYPVFVCFAYNNKQTGSTMLGLSRWAFAIIILFMNLMNLTA